MSNKMDKKEDFEYLAKRAKLFLSYLDNNNIQSIFPLREKAWDDLNERIESGSNRRIKILNDIIDNLLIGKNSLTIDERYKILDYFKSELSEDNSSLIQKKKDLFNWIISKGIIDSNIMINDAIEIQNSEILGLTIDDKNTLKEIIKKSMQKRIAKIKNAR